MSTHSLGSKAPQTQLNILAHVRKTNQAHGMKTCSKSRDNEQKTPEGSRERQKSSQQSNIL